MGFNKKLLSVIVFILLFSCDLGTTIVPEPVEPVPVNLSDEIDVYVPGIIHNNLVLAIENGGTTSYLVNKEGKKLFRWNFDSKLGNDLELLPNGKVLGMFKVDDPDFGYGGYGGIVKIINPDNTVDWEFEYASADHIAHHDVELLPNGNLLFLVWEKINASTAQQAGARVTYDIAPEKLIEINPNTNEIVWEWRSWDHIIQDTNVDLPNFGVVKDNPNKIDINYALRENGDIMHANGIDHDAVKDVIYISVNFYNEVWVIDHSTTTQEAASESGGNYNKGGDLLYRFGNPDAYDNLQGERLFDRNHFPNLLENNQPGEGNLLIYVNGNSIEQSTVYELDIPDTFSLVPDTNNEPPVVWSFTDKDMFFGKISGAERLSNGNTLICEGDYGYWEITPKGEIAWKYNGQGKTFWRGYAYDLNDSRLSKLGLTFNNN